MGGAEGEGGGCEGMPCRGFPPAALRARATPWSKLSKVL